jgi:hypothetical protein
MYVRKTFFRDLEVTSQKKKMIQEEANIQGRE